MNQIQIYMDQLTKLLALYSELVICLVVACLFSLLIGWMISRSSAKKKLERLDRGWEKRYLTLEDTARTDSENLEEQLQALANETKTLQSTNKVLTESLKKNDSSIQRARAESIELNRQHAETQERLQRIIQQRDKEILELGNRMTQAKEHSSTKGTTLLGASLSGKPDRRTQDFDLNHADTVAINAPDSLDATLQMSPSDFARPRAVPSLKPTRPSNADSRQTNEMNKASDLPGDFSEELEESTIALDDEALAFARRSSPAGSRD